MDQESQLLPKDLLHSLHGGTPEDSGRDTIILVEPDEAVRRIMVRILGKIFPGYKIDGFSDQHLSAAHIRDSAADRVAMAIDTDNDTNEALVLTRCDERGTFTGSGSKEIDFTRVPIILAPGFETDKGPTIRALLDERKIDGVISKPVDAAQIEQICGRAIESRLSLFNETESESKKAVLADFVEYAKSFLPLWKKIISECSCYPDGPVPEEDTIECDFSTMYSGLNDLESLITDLQARSHDLDKKFLSKMLHDIANKLWISSLVDAVLENKASSRLTPQEQKGLKVLYEQFSAFIVYFQRIQTANRGTSFRTWTDVRRGRMNFVQESQKLNLGGVKSVCIIDDDPTIHSSCSRIIRTAGGVCFAASSQEDLASLGHDESEKIDLFLLDNDLGEGRRGYQLISSIRGRWPDALIIAHTGDSDALNKDPENPYKTEGVEVVSKHEWTAISGIIRRKFQEI